MVTKLKMENKSKQRSLKSRMRDLSRSISVTTNEETKVEKVEKLEELKILKRLNMKNPKAWTRYKSVRFFERRKLERKWTQVMKKLEANPENEEFIAEERRIADDIAYVKYYPWDKKYISLLVVQTEESKKYQAIMRKFVKDIIAKRTRQVVDQEIQPDEVIDDPVFELD